MTDNMKLWNEVKRPPTTALKQIKGGRLSGMSNISPQWRWQAATEQFGMIGFGWKYTVEKRWLVPCGNGEQLAFVDIFLYVKVDGEWSEAIPGSGGSKLSAMEGKGLYNSDEAYKMAETDAIGTAMAKLGFGADVYLGNFDGSKYNEPTEFKKSANTPKEAKEAVKGVVETAEELAGGEKLSAATLRKSDNVNAIKAGLKEHNLTTDIPVILEAIKHLENASIQEVVAFIMANGKTE